MFPYGIGTIASKRVHHLEGQKETSRKKKIRESIPPPPATSPLSSRQNQTNWLHLEGLLLSSSTPSFSCFSLLPSLPVTVPIILLKIPSQKSLTVRPPLCLAPKSSSRGHHFQFSIAPASLSTPAFKAPLGRGSGRRSRPLAHLARCLLHSNGLRLLQHQPLVLHIIFYPRIF